MRVTPHLDVQQIVADDYRRGSGYRSWRPEGTNDWLLIYTFSGSGDYRSGTGEVFCSSEGDCTLYEPGAWQQYSTELKTGQWGLLWAHFQPFPHWRAWLNWPQKWRGLRSVSISKTSARQKIELEMREVVKVCRTGLPLHGDLGLNGLERVLLEIEIERRGHPLGKLDERILKAVHHLAMHFQKPFTVNHLAKECGLSGSRFAHLFKTQTGVTPQRMLEENRMRHAARILLSSGLNVAEIAGESGYEDAFYFTHRFRLFFGKSPREFRKSGGN